MRRRSRTEKLRSGQCLRLDFRGDDTFVGRRMTPCVATYLLNAIFAFRTQMLLGTAWRFTHRARVLWAFNDAFYSAMFYLTSIHYLILVVINLLLFTP